MTVNKRVFYIDDEGGEVKKWFDSLSKDKRDILQDLTRKWYEMDRCRDMSELRDKVVEYGGLWRWPYSYFFMREEL